MAYTLTTPLYYVNDKPHLGSTYTTIACDALARFHRLEGHEVIFITGVDEHGQKIQRAAEAMGIPPQQHCDQVADTYKDLWQKWGISQDRFVRTSCSKHRQLIDQFFKRVEDNGDVRIGRQKGWYCVGCEEYKDHPQEANEPQCEIHKRELEWRDEENLFFRLSKYQNQIESLISEEQFISPSSRKHEIQNFVAQGLRDFSISRVGLSWGVPVPGYEGHTFYVWFDALLGYLSALLDDGGSIDINRLKQSGWPASIHVIGKDILRFHAVFWPAMLMSAGLPMPKHVFGHGFLTREGQKMGKSLGNVLDPKRLLDLFGPDSLRWYLLRDIQFGEDGDFQQQRFIELVNNDLANTIGNLLNRTVSMSRKWFNNSVPSHNINPDLEIINPLISSSRETIDIVRFSIPKLSFDKAADSILNLATQANVYLNDQAPWTKMKTPGHEQQVANDIYTVLEACRIVGVLLAPLTPELSQRILNQLTQGIDQDGWSSNLVWGRLECGSTLPIPSPVMEKLEINTTL